MPPLIQWVLLLFGAWLIYLNVTSLLDKKKNLARAQAAAKWPTTSARVLTSRIVEGHSIDSETKQKIHTYRPEIEYSYVVNAKEFKSTRQAFGNILWYQSTEAEQFLQSHSEGSSIPVYYDPANPGEAVLDPSASHATKLVAADFAMLAIGAGMVGLGVAGIMGAL